MRRAGVAVGILCVAGAAWWAVQAPHEPSTSVGPFLPSVASMPTPTPTAQGKLLVLHIRRSVGVFAGPSRPTVQHGPAWVRDLDARYAGPPTPAMLHAMDTLGVDLTGPSWALGGWSEWSDLVMLRSAMYTTAVQGNPEAFDEVLDGIDAARARWPHAEEFDELAVRASFVDGRGGGRLDRARALLDDGRNGAELTGAMVAEGVSHLLYAQPDAPRFVEDHRRLRWVAETFPERRKRMMLLALGMGLTHGQPEEAARWMDELDALPGDWVMSPDDHKQLRLGIVAMGGRAPTTWEEQVAAAVGGCWDGLPPVEKTELVAVTGHMDDGNTWTWSPGTGGGPEHGLASCLGESSLGGAPEGFDGVRVQFFHWPE